jgi:hypothetical protein
MDSVLFQSTQLQLSPSDDGMMALPTQQPDADDDAELLAAPTQLEYSEKGSPEETRQSVCVSLQQSFAGALIVSAEKHIVGENTPTIPLGGAYAAG